MDSAAVAQSAQAVQNINQILSMASQQSVEQAQKLVKVNLEIALSAEIGKGQNIDISA